MMESDPENKDDIDEIPIRGPNNPPSKHIHSLKASFLFEAIESDKDENEQKEDQQTESKVENKTTIHPFLEQYNKSTSFKHGSLRADSLFGEIEVTQPKAMLTPLDKDIPKNNIFEKNQMVLPDVVPKEQHQEKSLPIPSNTNNRKIHPEIIQVSFPSSPNMRKGSVTGSLDKPNSVDKQDIDSNETTDYSRQNSLLSLISSSGSFTIPKIPIGLVSHLNLGFYLKVLYYFFFTISLIASLLAIFGCDLMVILLPGATEQHVGLFLLSLSIYLLLETIVCCLVVEGYWCSSCFMLDCFAMFAVIVELVNSQHTLEVNYAVLDLIKRFTLLKSARMTNISTKLGRLATIRVGRVVVFGRRVSVANQGDNSHGVAGQFGPKGYEDDRALYLYIKEKFTFAFSEAEVDGKCSRDDFTMMVRSVIKIDLEPEEEELLYRIMTVFGRSQEMKHMEDKINHHPDIAPGTFHKKVNFTSPPIQPRPTSIKKQRSASVDPGSTPFFLASSPGSNTNHVIVPKAKKIQKLASLGKSFSSSFFSRSPKSEDSVTSNFPQTTTELKAIKSILAASEPSNSPSGPPPNISNSSDGSHSDWERRIIPSLSGSKRGWQHSKALFGHSDKMDIEEEAGDGDLLLTSEARLERSQQQAIMFEEMKAWEASNPIMALRLQISTSLRPLDNDTLVWGLQLFRQVEDQLDFQHATAHSRRNHQLDERGCIGAPEFETRLEEALIVDGNHIFESLTKMKHRIGQKSARKSSRKISSNFRIFKSSTDESKSIVDSSTDTDLSSSLSPSISNSETSKTGSILPDNLIAAWRVLRRNSSSSSETKTSGKSLDNEDLKTSPVSVKPRRTSSEYVPVNSLSRNTTLSRVDSESVVSRNNSSEAQCSSSVADDPLSSFPFPDPSLKPLDLLNIESELPTPTKMYEDEQDEGGGHRFVARRATSMEAYRMKFNFGGAGENNDNEENRLSPSVDESVRSTSSMDSSQKHSRRRNSALSLSDNSFDGSVIAGSMDTIKEKFGSLPQRIRSFSIESSRGQSENDKRSSWRSRLRVPLVSTSKDKRMSSEAGSPLAAEMLSAAEKNAMSKRGLMDVLTKVKGQMRTKMKEEIISDSKFGSGDNMANRIDRGTTRVAMLGVFFMFLLAPQLANPPDKCDVDIGGISGFKMLKARVKAVGNVAGTDTISDSDCEDLVKSDEAIQSMVYEYRLLDPEPFLIRFYDCTLHMNSDFVQYGNNGKLQVTNLRSIFVGHVPCAHNEFEHTSTMVAFDLRKVRREEAYYHIALSISLITLLFVLSYALGRDTAMLTEVIVSPLTQLAKDMDRVSRFDLTTRRRTGSRGSGKLAKSARDSLRRSVSGNHLLGEDDDPESSIAEVRSIQQSFVRMRTTIQSFAKYVPQDVVYQLVRAKAGMAKLAVEEQEVTVLFSDIENFTKICESLGVGDQLLDLMSDYFTAMSEIITSTGGCLLEFIGDAVLAVWNAPNPEEKHATQAVTAALEMQAYLNAVAEEWDAKGYPRVRIRCGIHTAKVLVGNIGAPNRMKYGVLGDGVNTASRLEETNKRYGTRTLISEATFKHINSKVHGGGKVQGGRSANPSGNIFISRPVDRVVFKGKTKPTTLYEITGFKQDKNNRSPSAGSDEIDVIRSPGAPVLAERVEKAIAGANGETDFSKIQREESVTVEFMKKLLIEAHNTGWACFMRRDFQRGRRLFSLVDEVQRILGPRTFVTELPFDFGDRGLGDKAAMLLKNRCDGFIKNPPPRDWDGAEVLSDKHF